MELLQGQNNFKIPQFRTKKTKTEKNTAISYQATPQRNSIQFDLEASTHESLFSSDHKGTQRSKTELKGKIKKRIPKAE